MFPSFCEKQKGGKREAFRLTFHGKSARVLLCALIRTTDMSAASRLVPNDTSIANMFKNGTGVWKKFRSKDVTTGVTGTADSDETDDLTVLQVVTFLVKWTFEVLIQIASLIPIWIWIVIAVVLYVRYLLTPTGQSVSSSDANSETSSFSCKQSGFCQEWYKHFAV